MVRTMTLIGAALGAAIATGTFAPAHASACLDTGKLEDRIGACWGERCATAYADATPQVMDDTLVVWTCAGADGGTYVCYAYARTYRCTDLT